MPKKGFRFRNVVFRKGKLISTMDNIVGPAMLSVGTILVSSMFAVLKSLNRIDPVVRASWRLQTTFLALALPSAFSIYLSRAHSTDHLPKKQRLAFLPPMATVWSGCGYALYNVGLCIALAKTSLLRASILSQCAPLFIVLHKIFHNTYYSSRQFENSGATKGVHWKHMLGVVLTLIGTGIYISSTTEASDQSHLSAGVTYGEQVLSPEFEFRSQVIGDLAAAAASAGYAIYISCGRQARHSAPVYIHLPGCVFVAMVLVSLFYLIVIDGPELISRESSGQANIKLGHGETHHMVGLTGDFCSSLIGWTCDQYLPRIAFLGVVCGAVAVGLINWSLNHVSALQAAVANSAEPIAASIIGIIFFSEPVPNVVAILSAGIIVFAMILCSSDDGTNKNSKNIDENENINCEEGFIRVDNNCALPCPSGGQTPGGSNKLASRLVERHDSVVGSGGRYGSCDPTLPGLGLLP